ncbi:MAG: hypothetical protein WKF97_20045 [Chitinophagaceae bacterium]
MKTQTFQPVDNMVKKMRQIRDEISNEIKDMTFEEERAYLDNLLDPEVQQASAQPGIAESGADYTSSTDG